MMKAVTGVLRGNYADDNGKANEGNGNDEGS